MVPVFNQYVGFGDMVAATEVASMMGRNSQAQGGARAHGERCGVCGPAQSADAADRRGHQSLDLELQQAWRYRFVYFPGTRTVIMDTQDPTGARQWSISGKDDGSAPEDYILVSRIRSPYTGGLLLVAAGLKQFGTEAAGTAAGGSGILGAFCANYPKVGSPRTCNWCCTPGSSGIRPRNRRWSPRTFGNIASKNGKSRERVRETP